MIRSTLFVAVAALTASTAFAQLPLTPGNLIVMRVGDATATLGSAAAPMFFDEYTTGGVLVQSFALPATAATQPAGQFRCVARGSSSAQGRLARSANGIYFVAVGFDVDQGTAKANYEDLPANQVARVVARLDIIGNVDTLTGLSDAYDSKDIRMATSWDGNQFWTSGASGGVRYVANVGDTTSTLVTGGLPSNLRCVDIFHGDVYATTGASAGPGIVQLDTGLPTGAGLPQTYLPGFPFTNATSTYDFYFASPTVLYLADDGVIDPGIQKYEQIAGTWTYQYTLGVAGQVARGLTGFTQNGVTTLWATTQAGFSSGNGNDLISIVDTGAGATATVVASAVPGTMFRGVRYYDLPSSVQRVGGLACGTADFKASGSGRIGTEVFLDVLNPVGIPLINLGTTNLGVPLCTCGVLTDVGFLAATGSLTLPLPNNAALIGATIFAQGIDFLAPAAAGCPLLSFATLTDGYAITMQ